MTEHEDQPDADDDRRHEAAAGDSPHSLAEIRDDAAEVARLRQRLSYYESFDRLIQENIARSADLMRETVDLRERTQAELDRAREEVEQSRREAEARIEEDRRSQRQVFTALVEELSVVRESAERLTRRVSEAVSQIGDESPRLGLTSGRPDTPEEQIPVPQGDEIAGRVPGGDHLRRVNESDATAATQDEPTDSAAFGLLPDEMPSGDETSEAVTTETREDEDAAIPLPAAEASGPPEGEVAPYAEQRDTTHTEGGDLPSKENVVPFTWSDDMDAAVSQEELAGATSLEEAASLFSGSDVNAEDDAANVEAISPTSDGQDEGFSQAEEAGHAPVEEAGAAEPRAITVLVHGVPRAATALSLQRHLAGLEHVSGVEAREYAEGVLRLQVTSRRPLEFEDIARWEDGQGVEPVHVHTDIIEVRLPGGDF